MLYVINEFISMIVHHFFRHIKDDNTLWTKLSLAIQTSYA